AESRAHRYAAQRIADARDRAQSAHRLRQGRADREKGAQGRHDAEGRGARARLRERAAVRRMGAAAGNGRAREALSADATARCGGVRQICPFATSSGLSSTIASSAAFTSIAYLARRFCSSVAGTNGGTGIGLPFSSTETNTT